MIESVEGYVSLVEHADSDARRTAITLVASEAIWNQVLDERPELAADVAMNKHLPNSVIDRLIVNECSRARSLVAMKRALTDEQFRKLAIDDDESVRNMIANNKKIPLKILEQLKDDECRMVSQSAKEKLQARSSQK